MPSGPREPQGPLTQAWGWQRAARDINQSEGLALSDKWGKGQGRLIWFRNTENVDCFWGLLPSSPLPPFLFLLVILAHESVSPAHRAQAQLTNALAGVAAEDHGEAPRHLWASSSRATARLHPTQQEKAEATHPLVPLQGAAPSGHTGTERPGRQLRGALQGLCLGVRVRSKPQLCPVPTSASTMGSGSPSVQWRLNLPRRTTGRTK